MERSGEDVWEVARFNDSLWTSVFRLFYNYDIGIVVLDWSLFV